MITNSELTRQSAKILSLIDNAEALLVDDDEMQSHFAKYLCILCSGFLENVVKILYSEYAERATTSQHIISFIKKNLDGANNPNSEKLRAIAKNFDAQWEIDLRNFLMIDDKSSVINYLIRERHNIAHGKDSQVTLLRIREYHLKTLEVVEFIENQCR